MDADNVYDLAEYRAERDDPLGIPGDLFDTPPIPAPERGEFSRWFWADNPPPPGDFVRAGGALRWVSHHAQRVDADQDVDE